MEATTNCWAVADVLRPHVAKVVVSNPMATKAIAQAKVKTDKVDAHVLAQLFRCDFLPRGLAARRGHAAAARADRPPHRPGRPADHDAEPHPQRAGHAADRGSA